MILIETRCTFQPGFVHVEDEPFIGDAQRHSMPRHCEQLVAYSKKSPEGQDRVRNCAGFDVQHDVLDLAKMVARLIHDLLAGQCVPHQ